MALTAVVIGVHAIVPAESAARFERSKPRRTVSPFRAASAVSSCTAAARIFATKPVTGTQDVNDPGAPIGRCHQAGGGVVHVLGSIPVLVGTAVRGGIKRRPVRRAADARKFLQPASLATRTASADRLRSERSSMSDRVKEPG